MIIAGGANTIDFGANRHIKARRPKSAPNFDVALTIPRAGDTALGTRRLLSTNASAPCTINAQTSQSKNRAITSPSPPSLKGMCGRIYRKSLAKSGRRAEVSLLLLLLRVWVVTDTVAACAFWLCEQGI